MIPWSMPAAIPSMRCHELVHPSCNSCIMYLLRLSAKTAKGAGLFFLLFQSIGAIRSKAMKVRESSGKDPRSKTGDSWEAFGKNALRFQLACVCIASGTVGLSCLFRNLIGRYWRLTTVFVPAIISGLFTNLLDPKTRLLGSILLNNTALSLVWKRIAEAKGVALSKTQKTSIFMGLSSLVSGLIVRTKNNPPFWFFNPLVQDNQHDGQQRCFHSRGCVYHIISNLSSYFMAGLAITFLKFAFNNGASLLSQPKMFFNFFMRASNLSMAVFFGLYSCIFQSIRCYLNQTGSQSEVSKALIAGCFAGLPFFFYQSTSILNLAMITATQVIFDQLSKTGAVVPKISYSTLMFALACGYLFDAVYLCVDYPSFTLFLINSATSGEGGNIAKSIQAKMS